MGKLLDVSMKEVSEFRGTDEREDFVASKNGIKTFREYLEAGYKTSEGKVYNVLTGKSAYVGSLGQVRLFAWLTSPEERKKDYNYLLKELFLRLDEETFFGLCRFPRYLEMHFPLKENRPLLVLLTYMGGATQKELCGMFGGSVQPLKNQMDRMANVLKAMVGKFTYRSYNSGKAELVEPIGDSLMYSVYGDSLSTKTLNALVRCGVTTRTALGDYIAGYDPNNDKKQTFEEYMKQLKGIGDASIEEIMGNLKWLRVE